MPARARMSAGTTAARLDALRRGELAGIRELRLPGGPDGRLTEMPPEILGLADSLELLDLGGTP